MRRPEAASADITNTASALRRGRLVTSARPTRRPRLRAARTRGRRSEPHRTIAIQSPPPVRPAGRPRAPVESHPARPRPFHRSDPIPVARPMRDELRSRRGRWRVGTRHDRASSSSHRPRVLPSHGRADRCCDHREAGSTGPTPSRWHRPTRRTWLGGSALPRNDTNHRHLLVRLRPLVRLGHWVRARPVGSARPAGPPAPAGPSAPVGRPTPAGPSALGDGSGRPDTGEIRRGRHTDARGVRRESMEWPPRRDRGPSHHEQQPRHGPGQPALSAGPSDDAGSTADVTGRLDRSRGDAATPTQVAH